MIRVTLWPNSRLRLAVRAFWILGALYGACPVSANTASEYLMVGAVKRHYFVVVPPSSDAVVPMPVILVFHPKNTDAALIMHSLPFPEMAVRRRFIAVFPDGIRQQWNGGRKKAVSNDSKASDDVAFVEAILDSVGSKYRIDVRRIYATGISNGAIFCYTLAARMSGRIAAIGPVAGAVGINVPKQFNPAQPVSIAYWVKADGCDPKPAICPLPHFVPDDGTNVIRFTFANGDHNTVVVSYVIVHGGHTWPGQHADPTGPKGRSTMSVDATKEILDFFDQHPKS